MKKIFLLAVPALALIASCSKNEITPVQKSDSQQISFFTLVNRQGTKADALIDGTAYPKDETFGTFAYYNDKDVVFPGDATATPSTYAELYIPKEEVKYSTPTTGNYAWTTEKAYYWPKQGSLTFFSFSPYDELKDDAVSSCDAATGITITDWDVDDHQTVDVMVADVAKNQQKKDEVTTADPYKGVATVFRHKLSQIVKFSFKTDEDYLNGHDGTTEAYVAGDKKFYINDVKINNLDYKGTYVSGNDVNGSTTTYDATTPSTATKNGWNTTNASDDVKNYHWYQKDGKVESGTDANIFGTTPVEAKANMLADSRSYLLVLPQRFANPGTSAAKDVKNIQICYTISTYNGKDWVDEEVKDVYATLWAVQGGVAADTTTGTSEVAADAWEINKKISYTITISLKNDRIYWAPSVENWEEKTFEYTIE